MRIGLYGGTFDPVHFGHLVLAEQCREQCRLEEVWFIPAGHPPHKTEQQISPVACRVDMVQMAIAGHPQFRLDLRETKRTGLNYTVDTVAEIARERPGDSLHLLIGADSLRDLPTWREPERILELAEIVAVNRPGVAGNILQSLKPLLNSHTLSRIRELTIPGCDISSRDLRQRVRDGQSVRYLMPRAVECYVAECGLYQAQMTNDK